MNPLNSGSEGNSCSWSWSSDADLTGLNWSGQTAQNP